MQMLSNKHTNFYDINKYYQITYRVFHYTLLNNVFI